MKPPKLAMVGTGTCVPQLGMRSSCQLLHTGDGVYLVDVGTGAIEGLLEVGQNPFSIEGAFLTHHHPDHAGELPAFIQTLVWGGGPAREKPFVVVGGPGTDALLKSWARFYGDWILGKEFPVKVIEMYLHFLFNHGRLSSGDNEVERKICQPGTSTIDLQIMYIF